MIQNARKPGKLLGIELMRGLASFSVVFAHSGDATWGETTQGILFLRDFFGFHVPFFLAISFYFLVKKTIFENRKINYMKDLSKRGQRIILPYIAWSGIYLILRILFFSLSDNSQRLGKLYGDVPSILLLGGASYHIYFLPLLLTGTLAFFILNRIFRKWNLLKIFFIFTFSCVAIFFITASDNDFKIGPNLAFQNLFEQYGIDPYSNILLRLFFVLLAWSIKCLPYISVALLINYLDHKLVSASIDSQDVQPNVTRSIFLVNPSISLGIAFSTFTIAIFPTSLSHIFQPFQDLVIAFSLVAIAFSISNILLKSNNLFSNIISNLGRCSLGIYLIHPLIIRSVRIIFTSIYPEILLSGVSIFSVSLISSSSFLISWLLVRNMVRIKLLKQHIV